MVVNRSLARTRTVAQTRAFVEGPGLAEGGLPEVGTAPGTQQREHAGDVTLHKASSELECRFGRPHL